MRLPESFFIVSLFILALGLKSAAREGNYAILSNNPTIARDATNPNRSTVPRNTTVSGDSTFSNAPSIKDSTISVVAIKNTPEPVPALANLETLGGNLSKVIVAKKQPYFVTSDIYVPSGKTVTLEPGVVLLFKNFTGMHIEGRLIAEGTSKKPIVFSSEFDRSFNPGTGTRANPYDWNGIYIHESGIGSMLAYCKILYSVYGITALTKYIKFDNVRFLSNGRSDLTIEGKKPLITAEPYSYTLTVSDAKRDGVPVDILMDPYAKKRGVLRYSGLSLLAAGGSMGLWWSMQAGRDSKRLSDLSDTTVSDQNSPLVANRRSDYEAALRTKNRDIGLSVTSFVLALLGGVGLGFSFTF